MRRIILGTILLLFSCDHPAQEADMVRYRDGRQLLNLNEMKRNGDPLDVPRVERISLDSIAVGEEFSAKIFLTDKNYDIVAAYYDCKNVDNPTVDTIGSTPNRYKLDGCKRGLMVENDTIYIYFRGGIPGSNAFEEITILTRDKQKIFRTQNYTFNYKIRSN